MAFVLQEIAIEFCETLVHNLFFNVKIIPVPYAILSELKMVSLIFPYLGTLLFCCLGWIASIMLRIMAEEIEHWSTINRPANNLRLNNLVLMSFDGWRRRYFLIVEFVRQINCDQLPFWFHSFGRHSLRIRTDNQHVLSITRRIS